MGEQYQSATNLNTRDMIQYQQSSGPPISTVRAPSLQWFRSNSEVLVLLCPTKIITTFSATHPLSCNKSLNIRIYYAQYFKRNTACLLWRVKLWTLICDPRFWILTTLMLFGQVFLLHCCINSSSHVFRMRRLWTPTWYEEKRNIIMSKYWRKRDKTEL